MDLSLSQLFHNSNAEDIASESVSNAPSLKWEGFVQDVLLKNGILDGVLLLKKSGEPMYDCGLLRQLPEEDVQQFHNLFECTEEAEAKLFASGIKISDKKCDTPIKYVVRQKTNHSIYSTTLHNNKGLVIVNLLNAILVCTHSYPVHSFQAAQHVEDICKFLR